MLVGVGCDVIEIERVRKACERESFVQRVFAPEEIAYCRRRGKQASASFAARSSASFRCCRSRLTLLFFSAS